MSYPVFIVCRDRLTSLIGLLDWLESVDNADQVYLVDNDSTYPPLLEFYATTRHTVVKLGGNYGHTSGWTQGVVKRHAVGRRFIYTDPDLLPTADCPADAIARMAAVLDADSQLVKCGFSLKIDDVAEWCREVVQHWEAPFWQRWDPHVNAWRAPIDTTFALHNPAAVNRHRYKPACRLPEPYLMRHLPWYVDPDNLDDEDAYYIAHADLVTSNWARSITEREPIDEHA